MTKRILAMVLVLVMVLSLVPAVVLAEGAAVAESPKAGTHTDAGHSDDCGLTSGWQEWTDPTKLPTEGQVVLKTNVETAEIIMTGDLTLCLNGYVVKSTSGRIIGTKKDADTTLTITDCTAHTDANGVYQAGTLTGGVCTAYGGGAIFVRRGGTLKVYDGKITGNTYQSDTTTVGGGAVMLQDTSNGLISKAFIYGGEISDNHSYKADGTTGGSAGAICVGKSAELTVEDGTFKDNSALNGGVIWANANAVVTIKDGLFTDNTIIGNGYGGVFDMANDAKLTITGGEFIGNTGYCGGALNLRRGLVNITGATFKGNTARFGGSAIYIYGAANLTIGEGTVITENICTSTNTAEGWGAAVFHGSSSVDSKLTLTGKVCIAGNQIGAASIGDLNFRQAATDVLQLNELSEGSYVVFSTPKAAVTDPDDASNPIIKLNGTQSSWSVGSLLFKDASGVRYVAYENGDFSFTDKAPHKHTLCNDSGCTDHTALVEYQPWEKTNSLPTEGNWYLTQDVTVSASTKLTKAGTLNLCLNGKTVTGYSGSQAHAYETTKNTATVLNISDCQAKTEAGVYTAGKFTGFTNTHTDSGAAGIYIRKGGVLNFYDGIIENCASASGGAAIYLNEATGSIYGGKIANNRAISGTTWKNGGGIRLYKSSLTVYGGEISGNQAAYGAGIELSDGTCVLDLRGGKITGNTAQNNGGGVNAALTAATVSVSGDVIISGNTLANGTANNLRLGNSGKIIVGELGDALIGVTASADRALNKNTLTTDVSDKFSGDDDSLAVTFGQDGKLYLQSAVKHIHCVCGKEDCTDTSHEKVSYTLWKKTDSLPDSGNYCLDVDVTVSAEASVTTSLNLCLNGHKVTGGTGENLRFYSTPGKNAEVINITDCTAETKNGVYTAGGFYDNTNTHTNSGGGAIYVRAGSTLNFYEGIISGCASATGGAALYAKNATINFYNGLVEDNKTFYDGTWYDGGALQADNSVITICGGTFTGNQARYGAVYHGINACVLDIRGGTFTGNVAQTQGGAINAATSACDIKLSGDVNITGNTLANGKVNNVRLGGTGTLDVADLAETAKVGVTANVFRAISTETQDYTAQIVSDDIKLKVVYLDKVLYMDANSDHKHCLCAGAIANGCGHTTQTYAEWDDPNSLPTSGSYFLSVDVTVNSQVRLEKNTLNLCLNGHTIQVAENGDRAYYMTNGAKLNISDCAGGGKFTGAKKGAILTNSGGTDMAINLYNGIFTDNHAKGSGGAIVIQGDCVFNMYGGKLTGNTAAGTLNLDENGQVKLDSAGNQSYTSANGGALYVRSGSVFNMYGGEISNNVATKVKYLKAGASSHTTAGGIGGGAAIYGTFNLYGGKIKGNISDVSGGGIFVTGEGGKMIMTGGEISGNKSPNGGGVITQTKSAFEMSGGKIVNNTVTSSGAGVYISTNTTFTMTGGSISGNVAKADGGGVTVLRAKATFKGGSISYNTAANGGGVKINGGTVTFGSVSIMNNRAIGKLNATTGKYTGGNGGAINLGRAGYKKNGVQMYDCPTIYVNSPYVAYNKANAAAGGMLVQSDGTKFYMYGGTFAYNEAPNSNGGAIYFSTKSRPNVYGGTIKGNSAKNAGGLYFLNTTGEISGLTICDNTATTSSAAMILTGKETVVNMKNVAIYDNVAGNAAGGFAVQGWATLNLEDAKIYGNTSKSSGGGIYFSNPGFGNFKNVEIYENESTDNTAGGVYVGPASRVTFENVTIRNNKAGGTFGGGILSRGRLDMIGCKILNNECLTGDGGGVATGKVSSVEMGQDGGVYMTDCVISGNKASGQGGGVYNHRGGPTYMDGCIITENVAGLEGGGAYANGRFGLVDSTVTGNVSGGEGFAVYFTAGEFDGHSYSTGHKKIGGNMIVKDNQGGNFYLGEGSAVAVVEGPLGEKTYMEITLHSGVLSEHLFGEYGYEGGNLEYIVTSGNRSLTDPEAYEYYQPEEETAQQDAQTEKTGSSDVLLYVGIGVIGFAAIAVAVLVILKKKKSASAEKK